MKKVRGLTKSVEFNNYEFVIMLDSEYEYHYKANSDTDRRQIFEEIQNVYTSIIGKSLPEYSISESLDNYHTTKDMIKEGKIYNPDQRCLSKAVIDSNDLIMQTPYAPPQKDIINEVSMSREESKVERDDSQVEDKYMEIALD